MRAPGTFRSECVPRGLAKAITILPIACAATGAQAHGFGQRFDLPLPLWLWLTGAGATIVLTFAALALFARQRDFGTAFLRSIDLLRFSPLRRVAHPLAVVLRIIACALFVLSLAAGFFGNPDAYANLIVTMVWVLWWVGMAFFCALVGDLWEVVNPLPTLYRAAVPVVGTPYRRPASRLEVASKPAMYAARAEATAASSWVRRDPISMQGRSAAIAVIRDAAEAIAESWL